jgi:PIN domain nuclease of toxin-antitoxin system
VSVYLLDTNAALIALTEPNKLPTAVRAAALGGPTRLSVITYWEVLMKSRKGKLQLGDPRVWWHDAVEELAATILPVTAEHVAGVYRLPPIHQDPFDRMPIAQAIAEDLELVTTDAEILRYASSRLRVVS